MKFNAFLQRCCFLFIFIGMCRFAFAQDGNLAVNYLYEKGRDFYQKEQWNESVREFKKVLLLDPENIPARAYLRKLQMLANGELHSSRKPAQNQSSAKDILLKNQKIDFLSKQSAAVSADLKQKESELKEQNGQIKSLQSQLNRTQNQLNGQNKSYSMKIENLQNLISKRDEARERMNLHLQAKWTALKDGVSQSARKFDKLRDDILLRDLDLLNCEGMLVMKNKENFQLKDTLQRTLHIKNEQEGDGKGLQTSLREDPRMVQLNREMDNFKDQINEQKQALLDLDLTRQGKSAESAQNLGGLIAQRERDIVSLKENLALAKKQIFSLKRNSSQIDHAVQNPSEDLHALKDKLQNINAQLEQKGLDIQQRDDQISELKMKLDENQQRRELSEKIIQEKDAMIKKLTESLQAVEPKAAP